MNYDIPNNTELDMSIMRGNSSEDIDDYILLDFIDSYSIDLGNEIRLLEGLDNNKFIERYVCIDFNYFLKDIKQGFRDEADITNQFKLDLPRCTVYLNKHLVSSPDEAIEFLNFKFSKDTAIDIMMLVTQALLGLPFNIIFNGITNEREFHLSEISSNNKKGYRLNIDLTDNNIDFKVYKEFRIFELIDDVDIDRFKIYIKLEFSLIRKEEMLMNIKLEKCK